VGATVPAVRLSPPTIADVKGAAAILAGVAVRTPLLPAVGITRRTGRPVFVKPEMLQVTGSFKFRGAYHFISRIPAPERAKGVVAYSSGNHAQGVAAAAARFGIPATIVMPADAPATKIARTKGHGATVVPYDRERESREEIAAAIAAASGATILPPYDHPWTMAGQGTIGLEIAADWDPNLEAPIVLVPASGGGLAAGIGIALEVELPGACVHLVEPEGFDDHARSLASGTRVATDRTGGSICDALLSRMPGEITFEVNRRLAGGAHAVSDQAVLRAMAVAYEEMRLIVEPGGAVGLAALVEGMVPGAGPVVVVLSGGNVDPDLLMQAIRSGER
jgi:threonine dehydratase